MGRIMPLSRDPLTRKLLLIFAGAGALAMVIAAVALLVWATRPGSKAIHEDATVASADAGEQAVPAGGVITKDTKTTGGNRFTLRLGQGFRFKDGAVVVKDVDQPDVVFKYVPKQLGGAQLRYNEISQQVEQGFEPTLTAPMPLLVSTHISTFDQKPNVARITTGDAAAYGHQAMITTTTRYALLQNQGADVYLLTLDELEIPGEKFDDWRVGFAYEKVQLPLGSTGGQINSPFPGKLIYRDWYQSKMIVSVDLTSGKETTLADGILPTAIGDRLLGYGDPSGAYVVRDPSGKTLATMRFNEVVMGPILSPDGTQLLAWVSRAGPGQDAGGGILVPGPAINSISIFDLNVKELFNITSYDEPVWTPDGKIIATGERLGPGLFEIDPATKQVTPIETQVVSPTQIAVAPDGKTIAFVTGERVWLIDRDGKNLRQLFQHGTRQQRPTFSPDGTRIAFILCNHLGVDITGDVCVIDLKTQEITQLRTNTGATLVPDTTSRLNWIP
jgi:hypothetical protein